MLQIFLLFLSLFLLLLIFTVYIFHNLSQNPRRALLSCLFILIILLKHLVSISFHTFLINVFQLYFPIVFQDCIFNYSLKNNSKGGLLRVSCEILFWWPLSHTWHELQTTAPDIHNLLLEEYLYSRSTVLDEGGSLWGLCCCYLLLWLTSPGMEKTLNWKLSGPLFCDSHILHKAYVLLSIGLVRKGSSIYAMTTANSSCQTRVWWKMLVGSLWLGLNHIYDGQSREKESPIFFPILTQNRSSIIWSWG